MGFKIETGIKVGVGVNKKEKELTQAIIDALTAMRADGSEKAIYAKYNIDYSLALPIELLSQ